MINLNNPIFSTKKSEIEAATMIKNITYNIKTFLINKTKLIPMKKQKDIEIAKERIKILFEQAEKAEQSLANKYIQTARKIAMKFNIRLPRYYNRKFCKHCYNYFKNNNLRVRTKNKKVVYTCRNCNKFTRYPIIK